MALQNINRGTTPNDGQGDSARAGALKINENFAYLLNAEATFKTIIGPQVSSTNLSGDVAEEINDGNPFTFQFANFGYIKYVEFVNGDINNIYFFKLTKIGGGTKTFGNGGNTTLGATNLFLTSQKLKSVEDFEEINTTVTEDFGDIGITSLIDYVNGISPAITIQATSVGATILKAIVDDIAESYLFKGDAGDYGQGELQLDAEDLEALAENTQVLLVIDRSLNPFSFNPVSNNALAIRFIEIVALIEASIITQTSELINDGADGIHPFIDEVEQEVIIGGVYDNFQVEGNIIVATNTDGKAVFTGFNISEDYKIIYLINNSNFEIQIDNENSSSLEENQISLPNNTANVGLQGTTKFAYITKGGLNKWQIIDVFGSRYMPEHQGLDQDAAVVVGEGSVSRSKQIVNLHDINESITSANLTDAELNAIYTDYTVGFEVFCENAGDNGIIYKNINNTSKTWRRIVLT